MSSTTIWIITAMLWYQGPGDYGSTTYEAKQFNGRGECLNYIWDNKADLVEELFKVHGIHADGRRLKTWAFYCESKEINVDEV